MNTQPQPSPPTTPPIEVDPGGLHSRPEVDIGSDPAGPSEPYPEVPDEPEKTPSEPDSEPGEHRREI
jgi:hypothetical protein